MSAAGDRTEGVAHLSGHTVLPLTAAQRGMWFAETLSTDYSVNIAQYVDLRYQPGELDHDLLASTMEEVGKVAESPYLRVDEIDGVPVQYIDVDYDQHVDIVDYRSYPDALDRAHAWMREEYKRPVDLVNDQLIVISLLRITDTHTIWYARGHHIIIDGFAALTMIRSAAEAYNAARAGIDLPLKPSATMAEIVADEEKYVASTRRASDQEHWRSRIHNMPERVTLSRRGTTAPVSTDNLVASTPLPADLQRRIEDLAAARESSMAVVLTAAFAAFLYRMSGTDDIVLSLPVTGRSTAKIKRAGGMLSNILPVRLSDLGAHTGVDLIAAAQMELTGALRHQRYRSDDIRRDAGLDGGSFSFGPIINMVFFDAPITVAGADVDYRILTSGILEDLLINFYQASPGAELVVDLHGNANLYRHDEIIEHHRRFLLFVERFVTEPDRPVADIDLLLPGEVAALRTLEQGAELPIAESDHILDVFERRVAADPDVVAVYDGEQEWTYAEFDAVRNSLARQLVADGVGSNDRVAVQLERGIAQLAAVYAVLSAGAAYVPIDIEQPQSRRRLVIDTAQPALVIDDAYLQRVGFDPRHGVAAHDGSTLVRTGPAGLAYVLFTSGSTGTPKGVAVSHRAVGNRLRWMTENYPVGADDVVMYKTPITFDVSVPELFGPMRDGAALAIARPGGHRDPDYLRTLIARRRVTVIHFVPSMLEVFVDTHAAGQGPIPAPLRRIYASGEALPAHLTSRVLAAADVDLVNLYGPTEAAVEVTEYRVRGNELTIPIGTPVPNTDVYVLDARLRRSPVGVVGELYLSGIQLADYYVGQGGLTADRFVADPFAPGRRMYRTGDLVRWSAENTIEYVGRTDFQVKIRGQRVELGEIEAALIAADGVDAAVAVVRKDAGTVAVVGYVKLTSDGEPVDPTDAGEELLRWCRHHLPAHMVPSAVVVLDVFPVNASGKLDRAALPAPVFTAASEVEYVPPTSAIEVRLVELLAELLSVERIGLRDNIFTLGADSLMAARLAARLRSAFDVDVPLIEIFATAHVADLAAAIEAGATLADRPRLGSIDRPVLIPLSYPQTRLWFVNRMDPSSASYNMPGAVRLGADIDEAAMAAALVDVVVRHEPLRTRFPSVDGEPVQEILTPDEVTDQLIVRDIVEGEVLPTIAEVAGTGFDLASSTPMRVALLRVVDSSSGTPTIVDHALVVVIHHAAGDGASLTPLITDLLTAYEARRGGTAPGWDPLAVQYADFALWQRAVLGAADDESSLLNSEIAFWAEQLADAPELLELPADRRRPAVPSGRGDYVDLTLDATTLAGMRSLARQFGVTTFTVLHSAFSLVLGRLAGDDDVLIGAAVAGRDDPALEQLVGMFVNTVVLRSRLAPELTVGELLVAGHRSRAEAMSHAIPFEHVVDAVAPQRTLSHSPLFQVALSMQFDQSAVVDSSPITVVDARVPAAKFDLTLAATEVGTQANPERMDLEFSYATDLFDASTIERLASYVASTVRAMIAAPHAPIARIDLLDPARIAELTAPPAAATPKTFREILREGTALAAPSALAVTGTDSMTYDLFESRTNQLARELLGRGVGAGDIVAIGARRSHYSVVAMVAIAKTGAAFVCVDPSHPVGRRSAILHDSAPSVGVTLAQYRADLDASADGEIDWIVLDDGATELQLAGHRGDVIGDAELRRVPTLDDLAYLVYTSGSTGVPKAAAVTNRGLANLAANQRTVCQITPASRVLHVSAVSFDASVLELLMAYACGATLVVADAETFAGPDLERVIAEHGATTTFMTPLALSTLDPAAVPTLHNLLCGGEALPHDLLRRWVDAGRRFHNIYGPTEATCWVTYDGPMRADDHITIGRPAPGVGVRVLDAGLRPTPDGVIGELYLTGDQLGAGYLHRSELTVTRFVADPFGSGPHGAGARMYRTGDRVARLADGRLEFHGRNDFQLKIRGLRIEPGEVDAVLSAHPDVENALSLGTDGPAGETVLVSYVTPLPGHVVLPAQLIEHAKSRLPGYMVPHTIMVVDEFVHTAVGKIDRSKLPDIDFTASKEFIPPRTQVEAIVAEVFAAVLEMERVSIDDGFFELGGNSLSATKVAARLSAVLDRSVPVKEVFEAPTVAKLAEYVAGALAGRASTPLVAHRRAEVVPVSGVQRGMWLLNRADPDSPAYNVAFALRLVGDLDLAALRQAVADIVGRHESLRTSYPMVNGEPSQFINPPAAVLGQLPVTAQPVTGDLTAAIATVTGRGFDITTEVPVRLAVLAPAPDEHVVVLVIHHISADGSSMAPLARDLMVAYAARAAGHPPAWSPLPVQYADYTMWQHERLAAVDEDGRSETQRQLDYWVDRLADASPLLSLPTDRPRPTSPSFAGESIDFEIPAELVWSLETIARVHNTTLFMVLHAAYALLLSRLAGQPDVVIGTPHAGRGEAALDDIVGMFVNSLALRTQIDPNEPFSGLLSRVRRDDLSDMAHAEIPFETIAAKVVTSRTTSYNPVFQAMFWFQNLDFPTVALDKVTVSPVADELVSAKTDLQLTLYPNDPAAGYGEYDGAMKGQLIYATDLFDADTADVIVARYLRVLEGITEDVDRLVGDIDIHTAVELSAVADAPEPEMRLADAVTAATLAAPDAIAIDAVTFGQLGTMVAAMALALPDGDPDAALTMALMGTVPGLAAGGPDALDAALRTIRTNAQAQLTGGGDRQTSTEGSSST